MSPHVDSDRCADVLDRLDALIDGDLGQAEAALVEAHIDRCATCRAELRLAEGLAAELRALPEFDIPERVLRTVRRRTRPTPTERLRTFLEGSVIRPVPAVAALAVIVLMVVVLSPWRGRSEREFTDQEVARAAEETKLALAYVGSIARQAELRVKEKVLDHGAAAQTMRGVTRTLNLIGGETDVLEATPASPSPNLKGS